MLLGEQQGNRVSIFGGGKYLLPTAYRLALDSTHCPLNWTRVYFFRGEELGA